MPTVKVELTPRIAELLQAGVISITSDWFSSGNDVYGRVLQPHPRLGLYPHQSMTLDELEPLLAKVRVPESTAAPIGTDPVTPRTTPVKKGQSVTVSMTNDPEIGKIPSSITVNGVANSLPKGSLCWKDLAFLSDDQLNRRLLSIGREIGADKAVSRIASNNDLNSVSCPTLYKWWSSAEPDQRFTLITNAKQIGKCAEKDKHNLLARLGLGQYPFRGTDRKMEESEKEEEDEEFSETGLRVDFGGLDIESE